MHPPLKLSELCPIACHPGQPNFTIPPPGGIANQFIFASERGRHFYAIQPRNHDPETGKEPNFDPSVAIIGLSPADTQITDFVGEYRETQSYDKAARSCSFRGLASDIILMLEATGAARQLSLKFPTRDSFDRHPDILTDSLVRCASLDDDGNSTDWRPGDFEVGKNCVLFRFLPTILDSRYTRLKTVIILGDKGWSAINTLQVEPGKTVAARLRDAGKRVIWFPHPAGGNGEYVKLAKSTPFPEKEVWVNAQWKAYVARRLEKSKPMKVSEQSHKKKRRTTWDQIEELRRQFPGA